MWWWILLISLAAIAVCLSKAGECYECGKRKPSVFSKFKTIAYCDECWLKQKDDKIN